MSARFTIDGSAELEAHLLRTCQLVTERVLEIIPKERIQTLLLGGGYGRGQGGVLRTPSGDAPYNDMEFYICMSGNDLLNQQKYREKITHVAEELSREAKVELEFKITSISRLQKTPPTMFAYDLAVGHRALLGKTPALPSPELTKAQNIPLAEATRLLMNRCTGLLFCKERLQRKEWDSADADFVGRNLAKTQLALGDVTLTTLGQYHWDVLERSRRVQALLNADIPRLEQIKRHHREGVEFKVHPVRCADGPDALKLKHEILSQLAAALWLWVEQQRLRQAFSSTTAYALNRSDKCPETNSFRNFLVNGRTFGPRIYLEGKPLRYPRERLLNSLPLLLWDPAALSDPSLLQFIQSELNTTAVAFPELVTAYEEIWRKFN